MTLGPVGTVAHAVSRSIALTDTMTFPAGLLMTASREKQ
jgi:hypothetical protein